MSKRKPKHRRYKAQAGSEKVTQDRKILSWAGSSGRVRFFVAFALSCIGLYAIIQSLPPAFTRLINEHTAMTLGLFLNTIGIPVSTVNDVVSADGLAIKIIPECTALFMAALFLCFVVFYPATFWQKAVALAIGMPALYMGNLVRLAATFMVSRYDRRLFEVVHVYLGQVFTVLLLFIICYVWLKWLNKEESKWGIPMRTAGFLTRFALIAACLFLVWMKVQYWYIWLLDRFMVLGFSLFNYRIGLAHDTMVYYETFSIITLISLAFASRSVSRLTKLKGLCAGLALLFLIHLFHRIDNVLLAAFNFTAAASVDYPLVLVGQYLAPALFIFFLAYHDKKKSPL